MPGPSVLSDLPVSRPVAAVIAALQFCQPDTTLVQSLSDAEWREALEFCDRMQLTLSLGFLRGASLPPWVRQRIDSDREKNRSRISVARATYDEFATRLATAGIEFVVLKGFTQCPDYIPEEEIRAQYDFDLLVSLDTVESARDVLLELAYEPISSHEESCTDHLPTMVRKTGWQWRGDFFDPELPFAVELHFRLWDTSTEGIPVESLDCFWERRTTRTWHGKTVTVLHAADALGYTCLHLLRHLLRGSVRVSHVFELAWFLESRADDRAFWTEWEALHSAGLRRLEAICFRLAHQWFACAMSSTAKAAVEALPANVQEWFERHGFSALAGTGSPNKDELLLHLCLMDSVRRKLVVMRRRLLPARPPGPVTAVHVPEGEVSLALRIRRAVAYARFLSSRGRFHTRTLLPALWKALSWWLRASGWNTALFAFLGASCLFNFGLFLFFLLYNLYLLDLGFHEDFLGVVSGATTAGSIAGTLAAAVCLRRLGLRRVLVACFVGTAILSAVRCVVTAQSALIGAAFADGMVLAVWVVSVSPVVALLSSDEKRPRAFSLFFASGITVGVLGGLVGGHLPGWIAAAGLGAAGAPAKRLALLSGCAVAGLAAALLARLPLGATPQRSKTVFPRSGFVVRFLAAMAVWSMATGSFNPFFNAYFSRQVHMPVEWIGAVFSASQLSQVAAILVAPVILRRLGLINGIATTQMFTALSLAVLVPGPPALAAAIGYGAYASFQYMSEPGTYTLLMNRVKVEERSGASALNFLVVFASQAVSASVAGWAYTRFGYPAVLSVTAFALLLAAALFRGLLGGAASAPRAETVASTA